MSLVLTLALFTELSRAAVRGPDLLGPGAVEVRVADARGIVVIFMSAVCPCSRSHAGAVRRLRGEFPDFRFVVVHANADEDRTRAGAYFTEQKLGVPVIDDVDQPLLARFAASRTPHAFVLDQTERIVYRGGVSGSHDGTSATDWPLAEALRDLRAGRKVRRAEARALGCTIARGPRAS